jgi:hypothetical protein
MMLGGPSLPGRGESVVAAVVLEFVLGHADDALR